MDPENSPYAYSPVDHTTYYINFYAPSDPNFDNDSIFYSPFYNHTTGQWGKRLTCESYSFNQWYSIIEDQLAKVQNLASQLIQYVSDGPVADAYSRKSNIAGGTSNFGILPLAILWHTISKWMRTLEMARAELVDAAIAEGEAAVKMATVAFENRYGVEL